MDAPPDGIAMCQVGGVVNAKRGRGASMEQVHMIGIDLAKNSFQLHGARADGLVAFRKKLSRAKLLDFVAAQPRCTVAMEACGGRAPLGPGDRQSRPCGATGPTDLRQSVRQAAKERRVGCGGDLRGVVAADHALCGCEDGGTAGSGHAVPDARSSGAPAHPDD